MRVRVYGMDRYGLKCISLFLKEFIWEKSGKSYTKLFGKHNEMVLKPPERSNFSAVVSHELFHTPTSFLRKFNAHWDIKQFSSYHFFVCAIHASEWSAVNLIWLFVHLVFLINNICKHESVRIRPNQKNWRQLMSPNLSQLSDCLHSR